MSTPFPLHLFRLSSDSELPFEITSLETATCDAQSLRPHRHDFYEVLCLSGGRGTHVVDYRALAVEAPCVFFVSPGQVHFWELDERLEGHALLFTDEFLFHPRGERSLVHELSFFDGVIDHPRVTLGGGAAPSVAQLVASIAEEYEGAEVGRESVLRAQLHILLVRLERLHAGATSAPATPTLVHRFRQLLARRFVTLRGVGDYARELGVSEAHLQDVVKGATGRTPGAFIRQALATEAQRLLAHTEMTVAEVGFELAFDDPSYFGRFFRREVGVSPGRFRSMIRDRYRRSLLRPARGEAPARRPGSGASRPAVTG